MLALNTLMSLANDDNSYSSDPHFWIPWIHTYDEIPMKYFEYILKASELQKWTLYFIVLFWSGLRKHPKLYC